MSEVDGIGPHALPGLREKVERNSLLNLGCAKTALGRYAEAVEDYKRAFADEGAEVVEGDVMADPFVEGLRDLARQTVAGSPRLHERLRALYQRLDRRLDRIAACEPGLNGQISAAGRALSHLGRRRPQVRAGLGLSLGLSLAGATAGLILLD